MPTGAEAVAIAAAQKMVQGIVNTRLVNEHFGKKVQLDGLGDAETATSWTLFADTRYSSPGSGMITFRKGLIVRDPVMINQLRAAGADLRPNRV